MSRAGYSDFDGDHDPLAEGRWMAAMKSAINGKRGQRFLSDLRDALDAMPVRRLIANALAEPDGEVCAIGSLGVRRGVDMSAMVKPDDVDQDDWDSDWECDAEEHAEKLADMFDVAPCLAREVMYRNDECDLLRHLDSGRQLVSWRGKQPPSRYDTPEERWERMRTWVARQLKEAWPPADEQFSGVRP